MQRIFAFFIPDFIELQRKSFYSFLEKGLIQEFAKRNPITNLEKTIEIIFYAEYYQLQKPEWTAKEAILKAKSYACRLYIPVQLNNKETKEIELKWVLFANLPLITKRGHFIINGSPRVIISQIIRSPGIYYQELIDKNKKRSYYADIISNRGSWLRIESDKKRRVWAKMKKTPKVSMVLFLQALGFTNEIIFQSIHFSEFLKKSFLKENHPLSKSSALLVLYSKTHPKKEKSEITSEVSKKFLYRKFMNPRTYELSELGRFRLNHKLGLCVPINKLTLTEQDILFATDYLINLEFGLGKLDDIDNLKNRRVKTSGELIQNQISVGLVRLEKLIREKIKKSKIKFSLKNLITTKAINTALREFFGSSQLSQFMDQTNPLAEITHKRRITSLGAGGINRETAGMAIRSIHPTHYGRICPIETPEGQNAGLVNSITTFARVNKDGFLLTPFYKVNQGQVQKNKIPLFFSADQEENILLAPGDLKRSKLFFLSKNLLPARFTDDFKKVIRDDIEYIALSPIQMISIATCLIPFLEHDDANRALMGSNMQRQAVPLLFPQRAIVGTGLESRIVCDTGHLIESKDHGFIFYVSSNKIKIWTPKFLSKKKLDIEFVITVPKNKRTFLQKKLIITPSLFSALTNKIDKKQLKFFSKSTSLSPKLDSLKIKLKNNLSLKERSEYTKKFINSQKETNLTNKNNLYYNLKYFHLLKQKKFVSKFFLEKIDSGGIFLGNTQKCFFLKKNIFEYLNKSLWFKIESHKKQVLNLEKLSLLKNKKKFTISAISLSADNAEPLKELDKKKNNEGKIESYELNLYQRSNQDTCLHQKPLVKENEWVQKGDFLADGSASFYGELALGKNILIAYLPWEGYNFEDAILISERLVYDDVYTSLHIEKYEIEIRETKFGLEQITNQIPEINKIQLQHLDHRGIAKIGSWVKENDILVGKVTPIKKKPLSPHEKLLYDIVGKEIPNIRDSSMRIPKGVQGRVIAVEILETEKLTTQKLFSSGTPIKDELKKQSSMFSEQREEASRTTASRYSKNDGPTCVHIYLAEKRKIQTGDKVAGRHGNKGIISKILPRQDMPYLPDGTPIDMVLNPLGVPSRMNVGQIFECLLGLAGNYLKEQFKIVPFDEIFGTQASRSLVYSKLYEARLKTKQKWLFNPEYPGKIRLFDGRTSVCFDQSVSVGKAYILKLVHLVDEKIHARSTGPYSLVTQQPLRGRAKHGGQRLGEMEVWALEGFGAAYTLQELLTVKSDDMKGRHQIMDAILNNDPIGLGTPESFKVLVRELQSLCLDVGVYTVDSTGHRKQIDVTKFS